MSTITKEWLQKAISQHESMRDEIPFGLDEDDSNTLAALRIALASLEAEAVCVIDQSNLDYLKSGSDADVWPASRAEMGDVLLYRSAPPAPVSVPDEVTAEDCPAFVKYDVTDVDEAWARGFNACRAAMLKHSEPFIVTSDHRMMEMPQVEAINAVTAMLHGAEPVQVWIPCSERMPQKNERVIIFINFNSETVPPSIHDAQFTGSTFRRGNATVNVFPLEDGYGVTHWMPLPAAPQQEA